MDLSERCSIAKSGQRSRISNKNRLFYWAEPGSQLERILRFPRRYLHPTDKALKEEIMKLKMRTNAKTLCIPYCNCKECWCHRLLRLCMFSFSGHNWPLVTLQSDALSCKIPGYFKMPGSSRISVVKAWWINKIWSPIDSEVDSYFELFVLNLAYNEFHFITTILLKWPHRSVRNMDNLRSTRIHFIFRIIGKYLNGYTLRIAGWAFTFNE